MIATTQDLDLSEDPAASATTGNAQAYAAIFLIVAIPALCFAVCQSGVLRIGFPLLSLVVGGFLYWRSKPLYVGLVCWLWFLTPFLRRLVDFQSGFTPSSAVLLAPYITASISGIALLTSLKRLAERSYLPYACALAAIFYGFVIGLLRFPLFNVLQALLNWVVPVLFGFFIYEHRELYLQFRGVIEKSFLYGVLLTGAYGIYQFFYLPDWDRNWMLNVKMNSFGAVEAMEVRVFSTMNAPAVFAAVICAALLLLFNLPAKVRLFSAAFGFAAFMLTMSRSSWLSLVAGVLYLMTQLEARHRARLAITVVVSGAFLFCVSQIPPVSDMILQRIATFSDPSHDVSYSARIQGHEQALLQIAQEPFGEGMGSTDTEHATEGDDDSIGPHDSTVLESLYSLGWAGTLIYAAGLAVLGYRLVRSRSEDSFVLSSKAILIAFAAQCLLNSVMLGIMGFMVWTFASMSLAQQEGCALSETDLIEHGAHEVENYQIA
jgi:hypothetical protein